MRTAGKHLIFCERQFEQALSSTIVSAGEGARWTGRATHIMFLDCSSVIPSPEADSVGSCAILTVRV